MSDAAIPLSFRPAQIELKDPYQMASQRMGLQQMAQATQLNDAKIQEERLKAQALEEDRRDNQAIQEGYAKYPGDLKKVRETIAPKVNPRNLQAFDKSVQEHAAGLAKMHIDEITVAREQSEQLARHLDAVSAVKRGDTSPEAVAARAAEWAKQTTLAKSKGLDPKNEIPAQYPGDETLPVLDSQLRGAAKHLADEEARRKAEETALNITEKGNKIATEARQDAAGILAAAAARSPKDYIQARAQIQDPKIRAQFPDVPEDAQPTEPLPDAFVENLRNLGMKAHEQSTVALTKQQREEQARRDEALGIYRDATAEERRRHNLANEAINATRAARERGETANAKAVDRRQWERELNKITEEEEAAGAIRKNIENALNSGGKLYVDEKGVTRTMTNAAKDENDTAAALTQRMRGHYETLINRLKRIAADKNNFGQALGMQIGTPTEQIHQALDADAERVGQIGKTPKPSQATTPTTAPVPVAPARPAPPVPRAAAPATAPVQPAPQAPAAPPAKEEAPIYVKLPNGKFGQFPNQSALDAWARDNGLTITKK